MDILAAIIGKYYGIDWLTLAFGLTASILVSNQKLKPGLACSIVACIGGMYVASVSGQTGFVVYNGLLIGINIRGILRGDRRKSVRPVETAQTANENIPMDAVPVPIRVRAR